MKLTKRQLAKIIINEIRSHKSSNSQAEYSADKLVEVFDTGILDKAKALYDAMKGGITGLGTDEEKIRSIFESMKNDQSVLEAVAEAYEQNYGDLLAHLYKELKTEAERRRYVLDPFPAAITILKNR